jgi:hypothetical protein
MGAQNGEAPHVTKSLLRVRELSAVPTVTLNPPRQFARLTQQPHGYKASASATRYFPILFERLAVGRVLVRPGVSENEVLGASASVAIASSTAPRTRATNGQTASGTGAALS